MSEASQALQKIARGTGIIFVGTIVSLLFGFISRAIIARHFSTSDYGVFNLALTVLSIALVFATFGFPNSLPREVAFYQEKDPSKVRKLISTALALTLISGLAWATFLFAGSPEVASLFGGGALTRALRILAPALPFSALVSVAVSISRGFGRVREQVYFQNVVYPILFLAFVVAGVVLGSSFEFVFLAYVLAQALTFVALTFDVLKTGIFDIKPALDSRVGKELVKFSVPLMLTGLASFIMTWTDTLMLGHYLGPEVVGLYNGAAPIAKLLPVFLNSAGMIFPPLATTLYARGQLEEFKRVYQVLTKWIFLLTLPIFTVMFLFPRATIAFFFGPKYTPAATALQILAVGFMFHTLLGLNGWSLIIVKESKFISLSTLTAAVANVILNALLIPSYGIDGAAIATAVSYVISNTLNSLRLYQKTTIQPFNWNYLKSLTISFVLLELIHNLHLRVSNILYAVPILIVFLGVYFFLVLVSRSVDKEDVKLLLTVEKKLGVDLKVIKRILKRFA